MKKSFLIILFMFLSLSFVIFTGCKDPEPPHEHTFADSWTKDTTHHWHASTCGHEVTEGKAAHTFGEWEITKEATEEAEGTREKSCTVCGYKVTEAIAKLEHKHTYSEDWTKDATHHWHVSTCEHTTEVSDKAEHTFGNWTTTKEATEEAEGSKERVCTVCNYKEVVDIAKIPEDFVFVKGTTINGNETWIPTSYVFVSGRKLTIPNLYVSDHEVTRGEYLEVMGEDPSKASAYDKDGNKLTGDDVLNNPVNYISWYDVLVYCNKLSIKENLTPCYTINGSTDPDKWGTVPTSRDSTWDAATCNFEAKGYRLPTEAEWEWLARGGQEYTYAGSNTVGDVAWYSGNTSATGTREVKTKAANGYGLYDMSGNVSEFCWIWSARATTGYILVTGGGSWYHYANFVSVSSRHTYDSPGSSVDFGFRVVRPQS